MSKKTDKLSDFESAFGAELKKLPLPVVKFSDEFQEVYGRQVITFAEVVHEMARSGDSTAIAEAIKAVVWIFAGAGEIVRTQRKARLN